MDENSAAFLKRKNGFTLVELLVVIGLIGVLAGVLIVTLNPLAQTQKANDAKRKSDLEQVQRALEQYYNDNNTYPPSTGSSGTPPWSISSGATVFPFDGTTSFTINGETYIQTLPKDPGGKNYVYKTTANGQTYYLFTSLDRGGNDAQACNAPASTKCTNAPGAPACGVGAICNYGVSSTNTTPN